jgi:putative sigma-54 modulation protein
MNVHFTFRNIEATEALKDHVTKKVEKFNKFVTYPMEVHVILSAEKAYQQAEITVHAEHKELVAEDRSKDLYESIDQVVHKIEAQLKKEREKRKGHSAAHRVERASSDKLAADVNAEIPHRSKKLLG